MKKKVLTSLALGVMSVGLMAGNAMALAFGNGPSLIQNPAEVTTASGQQALETIVNAAFTPASINVYNDQTGIGGWQQAELNADAYLVSLGYAVGQDTPYNGVLGIYDLNDINKTYALLDTSSATSAGFNIKLDGTLIINNSTVGTGWSQSFGFYFDQTGVARHYTEDDKNSDGQNYAATYRIADGTFWVGHPGKLVGNNDWLIAFESNDWVSGEKRDFNDGVFVVEDLKPVPEPATMLLFGTGIASLAGVIRRRKK